VLVGGGKADEEESLFNARQVFPSTYDESQHCIWLHRTTTTIACESVAILQMEGASPMSLSPDDPAKLLHIRKVELAQAGDSDAFTWLFQHHKTSVFRYLFGRIGNDEDAHDLVQQTFISVWQKLPTLRDASRFTPWLYTIARNLAIDAGRRKGRDPQLSLELQEEQHVLVSQPGPEDAVVEAEFVRRALAELPPKYRDCLLLQVEGGLTHAEIAGLLDITPDSAKTYTSNARRQFLKVYHRLEQELSTSVTRRSIL
jgi:RNA polymerase sigma factor (sigma-70 family)